MSNSTLKESVKASVIMMVASLLFNSHFLSAQDDTYATIIADLSSTIQTVTAKDNSFEQTFIAHPEAPYRVLFTNIQTDKKGKTTENKYDLNLNDLDPNLVRWESKKDVIEVVIKSDSKQKIIQHHKNGELQNFTNQVKILAIDADNGKEIQSLIKSIIPLARKGMESELDIPDFASQANWLKENIKSTIVVEDSYEQSWQQEEDTPLNVAFNISRPGKKETKEEVFNFNIGDLSEQTVKMQIKGKKIFVEIGTQRKLKMIAANVNGELENYTNKIQIYTDQTDHARHLVQVLRKIIPTAKKKLKSQNYDETPLTETLSLVQQKVLSVEIEDKSYDQQLESECISSLSGNVINRKGEILEKRHFNFADLNPGKTAIKIKGKEVFVENEIQNKQKLVQYFKDEELQNYEKSFRIRSVDIENARQLSRLIPKVIKYCKEQLATWQTPSDLNAQIQWLSEQVGNIKIASVQYEQAFKLLEDPCKCQLTRIKNTEKKSTEEIWEFNLTDLDPKKIEFDISRKDIFVKMGIRYNEKTIKSYKNGKTENYTNNVSILVKDIETARQLIKVTTAAIQECNH